MNGYGDIKYGKVFGTIVFATREGLDVWLLGGRMEALLIECEHACACL